MELVSKYGVYALGFFAQSLFGTRLIAQLVISERKGKVVSPNIYWQLGVIASFLFLIYGIIRNDLVIILGQTLAYYIYIRNLQLKRYWETLPFSLRAVFWVLPLVTFLFIQIYAASRWTVILSRTNFTDLFVALGAIGQLMLSLRYIYQWIYSEKQNESLLPVGFWIISAVASLMIIIYAYYRVDPVLLVAQGMGIFVYVRNVIIHFRQRPPLRNHGG